MKKLALLVLASLAFGLTCCEPGNLDIDEPDATSGVSIPSHDNEGGSGTAGDGKTIIIFFSRAGENWQVGVVERGNTAIMVDYLLDATGADVFEIVPESTYPSSYDEMLTVATNEKNNKARPKFKGGIDNLSDYTNIFIGGPIWWGEPPMILHTFCETYKDVLKDKTIIPFGTHGGSGVSSYKAMLQTYFPNAKYLENLGISGASIRDAASKTTVSDWVKKLGLEKKSQSE